MPRDHDPSLTKRDKAADPSHPLPVASRSGRGHGHRWWQADDRADGIDRPADRRGQGDDGGQAIDLRVAAEDQVGKREEPRVHLRKTRPKPGAGRHADPDADGGDQQHEFDIVLRYGAGRIADGLQQADLFAFQRDQARQRHVDQHRRDQKKDRRQNLYHRRQLLQLGIQEGMADLVAARRGPDPAIGGGHVVQRFDHPVDVRPRGQFQHDVRERAFKVERGLEAGAGGPDNAEPARVGHHLAGAKCVDELG